MTFSIHPHCQNLLVVVFLLVFTAVRVSQFMQKFKNCDLLVVMAANIRCIYCQKTLVLIFQVLLPILT